MQSTKSSTLKEHKQIKISFFEQMKKKYCLSEEIYKTYKEYSDLDLKYKIYADLCLDSTYYAKLDEETIKELDDYSDKVEKNYLTNGLSEKEVQERQQRDGPNKLPEKPHTHLSVMFIHEMLR